MIKAAGCVFTNGRLILAGYQAHKKHPMITGLGGKLEEQEDPLRAGWRETLEELFEWNSIQEELLQFCMEEFVPENIFTQNSYVQYVYSFKVLERVLQECYTRGMTSKLYEQFPFTLQELLLDRDPKGERVEVEQLAMIPMEGQMIARHFLRDIQMVYGKKEKQEVNCLLVSDSD